MANPFSVDVPNVLQSLMLGEQSYKDASKSRATRLAGDALQSGDYAGASKALFDSGNLEQGLALAKMGKEQEAANVFQRLFFPGMGGGSPSPAGPSGPAPDRFSPQVAKARDAYGVDPGYMNRLIDIESKGNPNAVNATSGATGLTQFVPGTWKQYGQGGNPTDPNANIDAAARLTSDNMAAFKNKTGRDPTFGESYLAHQQGVGGATALLKNPNANVVDALAPAYGGDRARATQAIVTNGGSPLETAGQFAKRWTSKFDNQQPIQVAGAVPTNEAPQPAVAGAAAAPAAAAGPGFNALLFAATNPNLPASQREVAKIMLQKQIETAKTPDIQNNYKLAVTQGYKGTFHEYEMELKKAGATAVTNDMRGENAEAKALGEGAGKRANETMAAAGSAPKKLQNLARMEGLLENVKTGKIEPARMNISAWAKSLGLDDDAAVRLGLDPKGVGTSQAIEALTNEMTLGHIGPGGLPANNFSDADRRFITEISPNLGNDKEANRLKIEASRRLANLDLEKGREWQTWRRNSANKGKSYDDFEIDWSDKTANRDLFGDLTQRAKALAPAPQTGGPTGMPQGAKQAADGKFYVPDPGRPGKFMRVD